jgi:opacity protein-like surface antigen
MRKLLLAAAALAALAAPARASDIVCGIRDAYGNNLVYAFGGNSYNANGTFGGTVVETGFDKNGTSVISRVGQRPIWVYGANRGGGFNLYSPPRRAGRSLSCRVATQP